MNDTPETNEAQFGTGRVSVDFARRLERERDEARKEAGMWKANHDNQVELKSIISKRGDLRDRAPRVEKLIAERDQLRAINAELNESLKTLVLASASMTPTREFLDALAAVDSRLGDLIKAKEEQS